jgi:hypothetical protein
MHLKFSRSAEGSRALGALEGPFSGMTGDMFTPVAGASKRFLTISTSKELSHCWFIDCPEIQNRKITSCQKSKKRRVSDIDPSTQLYGFSPI